MTKPTISISAMGLLVGVAMAALTGVAHGQAPTLSKEEKDSAKNIYFQRCAGCHGVLRKGATGKNLEPANMLKLGQARLEKIIANGTDGGMVNFDDILSKDEIKQLDTYLMLPPDTPPA